MMGLNDWLQRARAEGWAIGHFNVSNLEGIKAILNVALNLRSPVIIGLSENEREFFGTKFAVAIINVWRKENNNFPVFLNADHTKTFEKAKEAIDAGFDSVHFDGSHLKFEENIFETKKVVEYAKSINPDISVEGELGYLRGVSAVQQSVEISPQDMTDPDEAAEFVRATKVDRLAPVFGNIHGIVLNQKETLDIERLSKIREKTDAFLVLHGASGLDKEEIKKAIKNGIVKVHINTEIRVAYRKALEEVFREMPNETTPYKYLSFAIRAMEKVIEEKILIFGSNQKV
jgi:fructose-bisphosphate aldolase class II